MSSNTLFASKVTLFCGSLPVKKVLLFRKQLHSVAQNTLQKVIFIPKYRILLSVFFGPGLAALLALQFLELGCAHLRLVFPGKKARKHSAALVTLSEVHSAA